MSGTDDDREDDGPASCPVCGADMVWEACWLCLGAGGHCEECDNAGGYLQCTALPHSDEQMVEYRRRAETRMSDTEPILPVIPIQARKIKELRQFVYERIRRRRVDWIQARGPDILAEIADAWRDPNCRTFLDAVEDVMGSHGSRE
jgi:hypothetical protein